MLKLQWFFKELAGVSLFILITAAPLQAATLASHEKASDYQQQGNRFLLNGNARRAVRYYQKAIRWNNTSTANFFNLAVAHYSLKNLPAARQALRELVRLDPNDVEALYNLGCLSFYLNDLKDASQQFQKVEQMSSPSSFYAARADQALGLIRDLHHATAQDKDLLFFLLTI